MKKLMVLVFVCFSHFSMAQPSSKARLPFCDSLQLILNNSRNGFMNYRYNELSASASITYSTTLPLLGFTKRFVQTGNVNPYKFTGVQILPYYIATAGYTDRLKANLFFNSIHQQLTQCHKPYATDTTSRTGFVRSYYYQFSKPVKDSFITIELLLLGDAASSTIVLRIFHSKGSIAKGIMKNPPAVFTANKNQYNDVLPLIKALMGYSEGNFTTIRDQLLKGERWTPTYSSIVRFRDFSFPKIEYVTNNLWNQYTTSLRFDVFSAANKYFTELAAAIDACESTLTDQRFETRSKPDEKWWYYDNPKKDVEGKSYKNVLRLEVKKFEYGDGYYVSFEFRKSVG